MSKQDKDSLENGLSDGNATAEGTISSTDFSAESTQTLQASGPDSGKSEQSRLFNDWLDRTLPKLQQYLGGSTTGAVTSPGTKPKH